MYSSYTYNLVIAISDTDLITNSVIILFIADVDELANEIVIAINPNWGSKEEQGDEQGDEEQGKEKQGEDGDGLTRNSELEGRVEILESQMKRLCNKEEDEEQGIEQDGEDKTGDKRAEILHS